MIKTGDIVRVIYKDEPWTKYFWKTGEVTLVEELMGTRVIHVRFPDGRTIGFTEGELQRIAKGAATQKVRRES